MNSRVNSSICILCYKNELRLKKWLPAVKMFTPDKGIEITRNETSFEKMATN